MVIICRIDPPVAGPVGMHGLAVHARVHTHTNVRTLTDSRAHRHAAVWQEQTPRY